MEGVCSAVAETIGGIYIWSESQKAAWDMFYEYNPSILFCLRLRYTMLQRNITARLFVWVVAMIYRLNIGTFVLYVRTNLKKDFTI